MGESNSINKQDFNVLKLALSNSEDIEKDNIYDIIAIDVSDDSEEKIKNKLETFKNELSPYSFAERKSKSKYIERSIANHYWIIIEGNCDKVENAKKFIYKNWSPIIDNIVIYSYEDNVYDKVYKDMIKTCFPYDRALAKEYINDILEKIINDKLKADDMRLKVLRHLSWVTAIFANKFELKHDANKKSCISKKILIDLNNEDKIKDYAILSYFRDLLHRLAFEPYPHEYILIEANKLKSYINQNNYFGDE